MLVSLTATYSSRRRAPRSNTCTCVPTARRAAVPLHNPSTAPTQPCALCTPARGHSPLSRPTSPEARSAVAAAAPGLALAGWLAAKHHWHWHEQGTSAAAVPASLLGLQRASAKSGPAPRVGPALAHHNCTALLGTAALLYRVRAVRQGCLPPRRRGVRIHEAALCCGHTRDVSDTTYASWLLPAEPRQTARHTAPKPRCPALHCSLANACTPPSLNAATRPGLLCLPPSDDALCHAICASSAAASTLQ